MYAVHLRNFLPLDLVNESPQIGALALALEMAATRYEKMPQVVPRRTELCSNTSISVLVTP
jgi:hypothetical protein